MNTMRCPICSPPIPTDALVPGVTQTRAECWRPRAVWTKAPVVATCLVVCLCSHRQSVEFPDLVSWLSDAPVSATDQHSGGFPPCGFVNLVLRVFVSHVLGCTALPGKGSITYFWGGALTRLCCKHDPASLTKGAGAVPPHWKDALAGVLQAS